MKNKQTLLAEYHDTVMGLAQQGLSIREIALQLQKQGLKVDHNAVYRYTTKAGIKVGPLAKPVVSENDQALASDATLATEEKPASAQSAVSPQPQAAPSAGAGASSEPSARATAVLKTTADFPDIDQFRSAVLWQIRSGCSAKEIWALLTYTCHIEVTEERIGEYLECLMSELYPVGKVDPALYTVNEAQQEWPDDLPILEFGEGDNVDTLRLSDLFMGVFVAGSTGSGKTSSIGRLLMLTTMRLNFGMLLLTTKPDEGMDYVKLAEMAGRGADVSVVTLDGFLRLCITAYQSQRPDGTGELSENMISLFKNMMSVLHKGENHSGRDAFWQSTGDQLLRNLMNVFILAQISITLDALANFLAHAPKNAEAAASWRSIPAFGAVMAAAEKNATTPEKQRTFKILSEFWLHFYADLAENTRSCIEIGFVAMIDALRSPKVHALISTQTNITPECMMNDGRIIILQLPVNQYHEVGLLLQTLWKLATQQAILRRPDKGKGAKVRPVVIWEEECHNFAIDYDAEFHRVARDCRAIRVMITQNIANMHERFSGGDGARVKVESILGNLNTRFFFANGCATTNKWASESIGTYEKTITETSSVPPHSGELNPFKDMLYRLLKKPVVTTSKRIVREPHLHPHDFTLLAPGGEANGWMAEAIMTQVGRTFVGNLPYRRVVVPQTLLPAAVYTPEQYSQVADQVRTYILETQRKPLPEPKGAPS